MKLNIELIIEALEEKVERDTRVLISTCSNNAHSKCQEIMSLAKKIEGTKAEIQLIKEMPKAGKIEYGPF